MDLSRDVFHHVGLGRVPFLLSLFQFWGQIVCDANGVPKVCAGRIAN